MPESPNKKIDFRKRLRNIYLYTISLVALIITLVGAIQLTDNLINKYVLGVDLPSYSYCNELTAPRAPILEAELKTMTKGEIADCLKRERERALIEFKKDMSRAIAMLLIGFPLYLYHWRIVQKENK